jgi:hypothetical protein
MPDLDYAEIPEGKLDDKSTWADFSFSHAAQHRDYIRLAFQNYGARLAEYILDPIDPKNPGAWAYHHQQMTDQLSAVINISSYDFTQMDFTNRDTLQWLSDQHSDWHNRASAILGV